LTGKP